MKRKIKTPDKILFGADKKGRPTIAHYLPQGMTGKEYKEFLLFDRESITDISNEQKRRFRSGL